MYVDALIHCEQQENAFTPNIYKEIIWFKFSDLFYTFSFQRNSIQRILVYFARCYKYNIKSDTKMLLLHRYANCASFLLYLTKFQWNLCQIYRGLSFALYKLIFSHLKSFEGGYDLFCICTMEPSVEIPLSPKLVLLPSPRRLYFCLSLCVCACWSKRTQQMDFYEIWWVISQGTKVFTFFWVGPGS